MRLAASTLALPPLTHQPLLRYLRPMGLSGVEVVPARAWEAPCEGVSSTEVATYRRAVHAAGLRIVGMDGLFAGRPDLGVLGDANTVRRSVEVTAHLSAVCRDLGGHSLILSEPRRRDGRSAKAAWAACKAFLDAVLPRIEGHGTVLCLAPLEPADGDVCTTVHDCRGLVDYVGHGAFGLSLSARALAAHGETGQAAFCLLYRRVEHVHADEPDLVELGRSGRVDHAGLYRQLSAQGYCDWITLKQRTTAFPLDSLGLGCRRLGSFYLGDGPSAVEECEAAAPDRPPSRRPS